DLGNVMQAFWARQIKVLEQDEAFYQQYKSLGTDQQHALVQERIGARMKNDTGYTNAQQALEKEAAVVPVALELGIVMLQRAQASDDTDEAASFRTLRQKDLDDQSAWLKKCNTAQPMIKAWLAKAQGDKAYQEGRDDEAAGEYKAAIDAYSDMPRSASVLNE